MDNDSVPPLAAGLTYNLKKGVQSDIEDIEAEYDSIETIEAISKALCKMGLRVVPMEADIELLDRLRKSKVDIVFNIAEGLRGRGREAQVPAILNYLGIPFVGSDETTLAISLDKAITKRLLASYGIKTPKYQVISRIPYQLNRTLKFPLIVKPVSEGSGKGIAGTAVVDDAGELELLVRKNLRDYHQPLLAEEYLNGREFTVGIVGNGDETVVFPAMEIKYKSSERKNRIYSYHVKRNYREFVEYECPARLEGRMQRSIQAVSRRIFDILECRDFSRIDFRMSADGDLHFMEINPLPGLAPGYSDYPMLAGFCGMDYDTLIGKIMNSALKRYGLRPA